MHDRYADVSRIIYNKSDKLIDIPESIIKHQPLPQSKFTEGQEGGEKGKDKTTESRPLNYIEVKPNFKPPTNNNVTWNRNLSSCNNNSVKPKEKKVEEEDVKVELKPPKIKNLNADLDEYDKKEQEMKDLDRLVNDLLKEASQIPDYDTDTRSAIPYHAREDSTPFRYCSESDIVKHNSTSKRLGGVQSEVYIPKSGKNSQEWNPLRESDSVDSSNNWNVVSAKSKVPDQKLLTSTPKSWNNIKQQEQEEQLPRNWSQDFHQQRQKYKQQHNNKRSEDEYKPNDSWTRVTVEHDESPITWTRLTAPDNNRDNNWSHNIPIPIVHESSSSVPMGREQSRDWNAFQDVRQKEIELEERNRSKTKEPRRQLKYGRSFSADHFSPDSDDWLAKQMAKLELKRSASIRPQHPLNRQESAATPAWLLELKQRTAKAKNTENSTTTSTNVRTNNTNIPITIESSTGESPVPEPELAELSMTTPSTIATPRFPSAPPTPYMNKSASRHESHIQRTGRNAIHNFSRSDRSVTDDDTEDEEEISKIMFNRKQEDELKFTVDTSSSWYKPGATREEAINALTNREVGTFIIRNSNSFPGAYGLAIKFDEHNVRHFLIEPVRAGVRLRGSSIEPVFSSLSALVYGHTIEPLALPCCLRLPSDDNLIPTSLSQSTTSKLLSQGAACQLLFLGSNNVEMLTGGEAVQRSISKLLAGNHPILVNLRLSKGGLVLTDVNRSSFFRNHHNLSSIIHAGIDPLNRSLTVDGKSCKLFGIVVSSNRQNNVLVLSEYEIGQPAHAIISFILRVIQWRS